MKSWVYSACLISACLNGSAALADTPDNGADDAGIWTLNWENDIISGDDDNYTNGIRISWFSSETGVPHWLEDTANYLPFFSAKGEKRYGFDIGQSMFTPRNISIDPPDPKDRPYAGWTYASVGLAADTGNRLDRLQLQLGIVGPASLADGTQDFVHDLIDSPDPQGWDHQLKNEPGIVLTYQRKWRHLFEFSPFGFAFDASPHIGGAVGNVFTHAAAGTTFRFGYDLPADYGPSPIQPALPGSDFFEPHDLLGWYLFAGFEGRAVARNLFLDGNTFTDSPSVDKEHWVGDLHFGVAATWGDYRLAYTHILRTREFKTQEQSDSYGSITLSVRF